MGSKSDKIKQSKCSIPRLINWFSISTSWGGNSAYEGGGDARRKFSIKPLKETDLGVAQAFFLTPKRDHVETKTIYILNFIFFACDP